MNIFRKAIVFGLVLFCLTFALQSPSYAVELGLKEDWRLVSLGGEPPLDQTKITALFDDDVSGTVTGSGGCNRYFGPFITNSGEIKIGPIASTRIFCGESINKQESKYFQALESATSYKVGDQKLELTYGSDNKSLKYVVNE